MANLWHFFGLPDPEGPNNPKKKSKAKSAKPQENLGQQTLIPVAQPPLQISIPTATLETEQTKPSKENNLVAVPLGWKGPVSADGEPFHDLGITNSARRSFPSRALRYVAPDDKKRIPTRGIGQRISTGDTVIVDLRSLVHMDAHQNACRRELKMMCEEIGVEVFALDAEDKLLMIPGCDVIVDRGSNHLGLNPLM